MIHVTIDICASVKQKTEFLKEVRAFSLLAIA